MSKPTRVVILGGGFVSGAVQKKLDVLNIENLVLKSKNVDLTKADAVDRLRSLLLPTDTVMFVAAQAPVKSESMLIDNLLMAKTVCEVLREVPPAHLVYISSDAVYSDSDRPLDELSRCTPDNLHGIMHLAREVMLKQVLPNNFCILRPTLIFGNEDPHNGYGPNRFVRQARLGEDIILFGNGEERRDHVFIDDVAEVIVRSMLHKAQGVLNIVTGKIVSFNDIANAVVQKYRTSTQVISSPRLMPMPHNGYREFDNSLLQKTFPNMNMKSVFEWIEEGNMYG